MNKNSSGMGVGANSILVIFVLLALLTFATLSLTTANADYSLARTAANAVEDFYTAEGVATKRLAEIDEVLAACANGAGEGAYTANASTALNGSELCTLEARDGRLYAAYTIEVSENKVLNVEIRITLNGGGRYEVVRWQTVSSGAWEPNDDLPVLQFDDENELLLN